MWNVFTPLASVSARDLARGLGGRRLKHPGNLFPGDSIVNWGSVGVEFPSTIPVFNRRVVGNKYRELALLHDAGIPVPKHGMQPQPGWLGRTFHHREGRDFILRPFAQYWVERVPTIREFRFHLFNFGPDDQRILRWGEKFPKPGAHPWVRSCRNGWRISYGNTELPKGLRGPARAAIRALRYSFGAVDIGLTTEGEPVIFEVNSAPGLDGMGRTLQKYVDAFREGEGQ